MSDYTCTYTRGTWFCPHDCDDPSHGRHGAARIFDKGRYWRPGELIETIINN